jgi:hypothetical protein
VSLCTKKQIKGRECSNKGEQIDRGMKMDDLHATHSELIRRQRRKLPLHPLICFVMLFQRSSVYGFLIGCNHEVGGGSLITQFLPVFLTVEGIKSIYLHKSSVTKPLVSSAIEDTQNGVNIDTKELNITQAQSGGQKCTQRFGRKT